MAPRIPAVLRVSADLYGLLYAADVFTLVLAAIDLPFAIGELLGPDID